MQHETLQQDLADFIAYRRNHLDGDEKGEAQVFLDRLFKALGHGGVREAGAVLEARVRKQESKGVSFADLLWESRCIIEMKKAGTDLSKHFRQAFQYWIQVVPNRPRYVVLCNFDELWVYDFDQQLDAPMDMLKLDDLATRREVLSFLLPEPEPPIFGNDLVKVTRDAAAQVAGVFRSMKERGIPRLDAQHFVLQSVVAMFAEDIRLLPEKFFTRTVDEAKSGREAYDLLGSLFREMNMPGRTAGGRFAGTPYFNGGLFETITPVEMTADELMAMRTAATTNWAEVRPEIFGTLFETSMDKGERHAYGAHFTSQADIARVVIPCIVDPWTEKIEAAKTIGDLEQIQLAMANYRVLDPACGSGNFLYVAYREMRRLEVEVKNRILARRKAKQGQATISYVTPDHFMGIDNNPFAIEVAKATLIMAKKLAADELEDFTEPLPLDNLDKSIQCRDALFTDWPAADVIIGNPPYMGRRKMVDELGLEYTQRLARRYPTIGGVSDFVTYWFPLAHKTLPEGGRAGFVATQAIRDNESRKASLDYIVDNDGVIFEAVSVMPWSGDAVVHVSIVNWVKGSRHAPEAKTLWLDNGDLRLPVSHIPATLRAETDVTKAENIPQNLRPKRCFQGQTTGYVDGFRLTSDAAAAFLTRNPKLAEVIHPMISGDPMIHTTTVPGYVIDVGEKDVVKAKSAYPEVMKHLAQVVLPNRQEAAAKERERNQALLAGNPGGKPVTARQDFLDKSWWRHWRRREDMLATLSELDRYIALVRVAAEGRRSIYQFVDSTIRPDDSLQIFALDDDYSFGILSSSLHRAWFDERCSKLKVDPRYTPTTVWNTFPWPASPATDQVSRIAGISAQILDLRERHRGMGMTLGQQYDTLREPGASAFRDAHEALDAAVIDAYGFNPDEDLLAQLLALNLAAASDPAAASAPGGGGRPEAYTTTYRLTA